MNSVRGTSGRVESMLKSADEALIIEDHTRYANQVGSAYSMLRSMPEVPGDLASARNLLWADVARHQHKVRHGTSVRSS